MVTSTGPVVPEVCGGTVAVIVPSAAMDFLGAASAPNVTESNFFIPVPVILTSVPAEPFGGLITGFVAPGFGSLLPPGGAES